MYSKNKKRTAFAVLMVLLLVMAAFAGCGSSDKKESKDTGSKKEAAVEDKAVGDIIVKLSIDFPEKDAPADVKNKDVGLTSESSVLDALFAYANDNNLEIGIEGEDEKAFVNSIGGVAGNDKTGWVYTINKKTVMESAGKAMLEDGDTIEWKYTDFSDM